MEIHEFQTSKCSNHIQIPFSICWSDENMVAMATEKGVYISDLAMIPFNKYPHLQMKRYFIQPKPETPTQDCGIDTSELVKKLRKDVLSKILQDFTMFPSMREHCYNPSIKQLSWSPCDKTGPYRSLLTILTDSGSLEIRILKRQTWEVFVSISQIWLDYWKAIWSKVTLTNNQEKIIETLKERTYKIKMTAFVWGSMFDGWCSLFTSNMFGEVAIWKVRQRKDCEPKDQIQLLHIIKSDIGHITSVFFQNIDDNKCLLLIASLDGRIQSIPLCYSNDSFIIGKYCTIWSDEDKIKLIPNGGVSTVWNRTVIFTVAKGGHLIVFQLNEEGHQMNTCIHDSEDVNVTGLAQSSVDEVMFTTRNGTLSCLSLGKAYKLFKPTVSSLQTSSRSSHYACYGFALSKSKAQIAFAYSVCRLYDHLSHREPTQIVWCYFGGARSPIEIISKHSGSLSDIWDGFETMRIDTILNNKQFELPPRSDLDVMDLIKLKKNLWFSNANLFVVDLETKNQIMRLNEEIAILIISCNIFKRISNLLITPNLNSFDSQSLFLMKCWVNYVLQMLDSVYEVTRATATTLLEQLAEVKLAYLVEQCVVCGSDIPQFTGHLTSRCVMGHTMPRCSLSLVQCDMLPYYKCEYCGMIVHPKAVSGFDCTCILCDNILRIDGNVYSE